MSGVHPNHSRAGERERKPLQEHYFLCRRESAGQLDRYQIGIYCEEETRPADQSLSIWCHQENAGKGRSTPHPSFVVRTRVHIDLAWLFYVWRLRTGYVGKKRKVIDFGTNYNRNRVPFSFGTFFWRDRACVQLSIGWHCVGGNKHFPKLYFPSTQTCVGRSVICRWSSQTTQPYYQLLYCHTWWQSRVSCVIWYRYKGIFLVDIPWRTKYFSVRARLPSLLSN